MDELKDELQSKIAEYSKMAESGKKTKHKETIFHLISTTEAVEPYYDVSGRRNARAIPDGIQVLTSPACPRKGLRIGRRKFCYFLTQLSRFPFHIK